MWSDCEPRPRLAVSELRERIRLLSHRLEPKWASLLCTICAFGLLGTASLQGLVVCHERDPKMLQPQSPNRLLSSTWAQSEGGVEAEKSNIERLCTQILPKQKSAR